MGRILLASAFPDVYESNLIGQPLELLASHRHWMQITLSEGRIRLSSRAEERSCPKGFSRMIRAFLVQPDLARCSTTLSNNGGGMAR